MGFIKDITEMIYGPYRDNQQLQFQEHQFRQQQSMATDQFNRMEDLAYSKFNADRSENMLNRATTQYRWKHGLENTINQARGMGINPLAALGANTFTPSSSSMSAGGNLSPTSLPSARGYNPNRLRIEGDWAKQLEELKILKETRKQAEITTKNMRNPQVALQPDRPIAGSAGATSGLHQNWKVVDTGSGYILRSRDNSEPEEDPIAWLQTAARKMGVASKALIYPMLSKKQKTRLRNILHRQRAIMLQVAPLPAGRTYKFNRGNSQWVKARKDGNLFMDDKRRSAIKARKGKSKYDYIHIYPGGKK